MTAAQTQLILQSDPQVGRILKAVFELADDARGLKEETRGLVDRVSALCVRVDGVEADRRRAEFHVVDGRRK